MKKLMILSLFAIFTRMAVANNIDYNAAKKHILDNYSCDSIEDCHKKKSFSKRDLEHDMDENKKGLFYIKHHAILGDQKAADALKGIKNEYTKKIEQVEKKLEEHDSGVIKDSLSKAWFVVSSMIWGAFFYASTADLSMTGKAAFSALGIFQVVCTDSMVRYLILGDQFTKTEDLLYQMQDINAYFTELAAEPK